MEDGLFLRMMHGPLTDLTNQLRAAQGPSNEPRKMGGRRHCDPVNLAFGLVGLFVWSAPSLRFHSNHWGERQ